MGIEKIIMCRVGFAIEGFIETNKVSASQTEYTKCPNGSVAIGFSARSQCLSLVEARVRFSSLNTIPEHAINHSFKTLLSNKSKVIYFPHWAIVHQSLSRLFTDYLYCWEKSKIGSHLCLHKSSVPDSDLNTFASRTPSSEVTYSLKWILTFCSKHFWLPGNMSLPCAIYFQGQLSLQILCGKSRASKAAQLANIDSGRNSIMDWLLLKNFIQELFWLWYLYRPERPAIQARYAGLLSFVGESHRVTRSLLYDCYTKFYLNKQIDKKITPCPSNPYWLYIFICMGLTCSFDVHHVSMGRLLVATSILRSISMLTQANSVPLKYSCGLATSSNGTMGSKLSLKLARIEDLNAWEIVGF